MDIRLHLAVLLLVVSLTSVLGACTDQGGGEPLPDIATVRSTARQFEIDRDAILGTHTLVTETLKAREPGGSAVYHSTVVRGDTGSDVETRFDVEGKVVVHGLYREITSEGSTRAWLLSGHHLQYGQRKTTAGQPQFGRWFEHPAVNHADAQVVDADNVDGRGAWVVEVPPAVVAGDVALRAVTEHVDAVDGIKRGSTYIFDVRNALDAFTRLWVDRDTGQLLRAEGQLGGGDEQVAPSVVVTWGDFQQVAPGVVLPHLLEAHIEGELFSTTRVISVAPQHGVVAADFAAVHSSYEILAQTQNEQQYRELIARTDIKQAEPDPVRDAVFHPDELIQQLDLGPGDVVADIGAGTGYFTTRLGEAVGPTGRVYATDINPAVVDYLRLRMTDPVLDPHDNVESVVNDFGDLGLPDASVDVAFLAGVGLGRFSTLSDTNRKMIDSIHAAVKPGGRVVVIENRNQGSQVDGVSLGLAVVDVDFEDPSWSPVGWPGRPSPLGFLDEVIIASFEAAGFRFSRSSDLIAGQTFLFLDKPR